MAGGIIVSKIQVWRDEGLIAIYVRDGMHYGEIPMSYEAIMALLKDDSVIGPDDFVEIDYPDGDRAAIRKRDISGIFYERDGTQ